MSRVVRRCVRSRSVDTRCVSLSAPVDFTPSDTSLVVFQFLGRDYTIFRAATVPRLALLAQYDHKYDASKSEWLWNKAKEFIEDYYERYWSRFPTIGYPLEFKDPLDIPGVPEPVDIEPGEIPLWEEQRMKREARARAVEQSDPTANV